MSFGSIAAKESYFSQIQCCSTLQFSSFQSPSPLVRCQTSTQSWFLPWWLFGCPWAQNLNNAVAQKHKWNKNCYVDFKFWIENVSKLLTLKSVVFHQPISTALPLLRQSDRSTPLCHCTSCWWSSRRTKTRQLIKYYLAYYAGNKCFLKEISDLLRELVALLRWYQPSRHMFIWILT